jgi:hypothetical protein
VWVGLLALLLRGPVLELPIPVAANVRYEEDRVWIELEGEIQDPVRVFAPRANEVWINNEKMTCRVYGPYRLATFPILHNQEPCEPY